MPTQPLDTDLYMACLNLRGQTALVVGGTGLAVEKAMGLRACAAHVRVVARRVDAQMRALAEAGEVDLELRGYSSADLAGALLVVVATRDEGLNQRVHADAVAAAKLVNVVDVPRLCNFYLPAIVRRGPIAVAISTSGASPALAKHLREEIAGLVTDEHAELAVHLNSLRDWAHENLPTYEARKAFFEAQLTQHFSANTPTSGVVDARTDR